jgi:pilus assembly protein Flp/PilA
MQLLIKLLRNDEAATAVEYAVMLAMILIAVIGAIGMVGGQTANMWGAIENDMTSAFTGS